MQQVEIYSSQQQNFALFDPKLRLSQPPHVAYILSMMLSVYFRKSTGKRKASSQKVCKKLYWVNLFFMQQFKASTAYDLLEKACILESRVKPCGTPQNKG